MNQTPKSLVSLTPTLDGLTDEQKRIIKQEICPGITDEELALLHYRAKLTGLDIFTKQIMGIHRKVKQKDGTWKKVMSIQIGIGGYRSFARRDPYNAGISEAVINYKSPLTHKSGEKVWQKIDSATVTSFRLIKGTNTIAKYPYTAWWDEYFPGEGPQGFMWRKMPRWMLIKCAIVGAIRSTYPDELNDTYEPAEMENMEVAVKEDSSRPVTVEPVTVQVKGEEKEQTVLDSHLDLMQKDELISHILNMSRLLCAGMTREQKGEWMLTQLEVNNFNDMSKKSTVELESIINRLKEIKK